MSIASRSPLSWLLHSVLASFAHTVQGDRRPLRYPSAADSCVAAILKHSRSFCGLHLGATSAAFSTLLRGPRNRLNMHHRGAYFRLIGVLALYRSLRELRHQDN